MLTRVVTILAINMFKQKFALMLVLIILISYMLFLYCDYNNINFLVSSSAIKYFSIILCFLLCFSLRDNPIKIRDYNFLQFGLLLTIFADLCLLLLNFFPLGIAIFCFVQITYSLRYNPNHFRELLKFFLFVLSIIIATYFLLDYFGTHLDLIFPISLFYSVCLFSSVIMAIRAFIKNLYPSPNKYLILIGMILFLLCDINVGIFNITNLISSNSINTTQLNLISGFLMWFFYLPSQLLLSLSGHSYT